MHKFSDVVEFLRCAVTMETAAEVGNHGNLKIF